MDVISIDDEENDVEIVYADITPANIKRRQIEEEIELVQAFANSNQPIPMNYKHFYNCAKSVNTRFSNAIILSAWKRSVSKHLSILLRQRNIRASALQHQAASTPFIDLTKPTVAVANLPPSLQPQAISEKTIPVALFVNRFQPCELGLKTTLDRDSGDSVPYCLKQKCAVENVSNITPGSDKPESSKTRMKGKKEKSNRSVSLMDSVCNNSDEGVPIVNNSGDITGMSHNPAIKCQQNKSKDLEITPSLPDSITNVCNSDHLQNSKFEIKGKKKRSVRHVNSVGKIMYSSSKEETTNVSIKYSLATVANTKLKQKYKRKSTKTTGNDEFNKNEPTNELNGENNLSGEDLAIYLRNDDNNLEDSDTNHNTATKSKGEKYKDPEYYPEFFKDFLSILLKPMDCTNFTGIDQLNKSEPTNEMNSNCENNLSQENFGIYLRNHENNLGDSCTNHNIVTKCKKSKYSDPANTDALEDFENRNHSVISSCVGVQAKIKKAKFNLPINSKTVNTRKYKSMSEVELKEFKKKQKQQSLREKHELHSKELELVHDRLVDILIPKYFKNDPLDKS